MTIDHDGSAVELERYDVVRCRQCVSRPGLYRGDPRRTPGGGLLKPFHKHNHNPHRAGGRVGTVFLDYGSVARWTP